MKLYEIPRNTYFKLNNTIYKLYNIDGMYSYCKNLQGYVVHIAAFSDVEPLPDFEYNIPEIKEYDRSRTT